MGIAANKFRLLYLKASKSDLEYKIALIFERRKALLDRSMEISAENSNNIFQTGDNRQLYDGQMPGPLPGFSAPLPGITLPEADPIPTGNYEEQTAVLQALDKELELDAEKIKIMIESAKTEIDSVDQLLRKNIEKEYKTFAS